MTTCYQSELGYTVENFRSSWTKLWEPEISIHNSNLQEASSFRAVNLCSTFVNNRTNDACAVLFIKDQCLQSGISVSINLQYSAPPLTHVKKTPTGKRNLLYRSHTAVAKAYKCVQKCTKTMAWQVTVSRFEPWGQMKEKTKLQKSSGSAKNIYLCWVRRSSLANSKQVAVLRHSPSSRTAQRLLCLHVCWCFTRSIFIKCTKESWDTYKLSL